MIRRSIPLAIAALSLRHFSGARNRRSSSDGAAYAGQVLMVLAQARQRRLLFRRRRRAVSCDRRTLRGRRRRRHARAFFVVKRRARPADGRPRLASSNIAPMQWRRASGPWIWRWSRRPEPLPSSFAAISLGRRQALSVPFSRSLGFGATRQGEASFRLICTGC